MIWRIIRSSVPSAAPASRVPHRVEVETPFVLPSGQVGADVADDEPIIERLAIEAYAERGPEVVAASPGGDDRVGAMQGPALGGGRHHPALVLVQVGDRRVPLGVHPGGGQLVVEQLLGARLADVDASGEGRAATVDELPTGDLLLAVERARRAPGQPLVGDRPPGAACVPHVEHVLRLADGLRPGGVALPTGVEQPHRHAPAT
jgi:hypothetical protein